MVGCVSAKQNYFIDEIYSYGLANNKGGLDLSISDFYKYEPASIPYTEYMTVSENERFDYGMVWENQHKDVHPPLYYVFLHTIASLFPGEFSIWFAGIINIVFGLATLFVLRKIIILLGNSLQVCNVISLLFVFSPGILSTISFFRMYVLAMFSITMLTYLFLKKLKNPSKKETIKSYIPMIVCAVMNALTHYYCIIYIVFISSLYGVYLIYKKEQEKIKYFVCSMLIAGAVSCLIFPYMLGHMLLGSRGKESVSNFLNVSDVFERFVSFWGIINRQLFGDLLNYILIGIAVFILLKIFCKVQKKEAIAKCSLKEIVDNFEIMGYAFLILPTVAYFLVVSKVGTYLSDRYMFPVYALIFVGTVCLINKVLRELLPRKKYMISGIVLSVLLVLCGWYKAEWKYLYLDYSNILAEVEKHEKDDCIVIYSQKWQLPSIYTEISNYKSVTFVNEEDFDELLQSEILTQDELVVSLLGFEEPESYLNKINMVLGEEFEVSEIGTYFYGTSYCFKRQ